MPDRYDDDADTDYLGEPRYTYTEEEVGADAEAPPEEEPVREADRDPTEVPLTRQEQDRRVRRVAAVWTIVGVLVGAVTMLVVVALAGGDPAPEPEDDAAGDGEQVGQLEEAVEEREAQIQALEAQLSESQAALDERDAEVEQLREQVGEGETELAEQQAALEERGAALERRAAALDEREQALDEREQAISEREGEPPAPTPGTDDGVPQIDDEEAEALVERVLDRIRGLFE